MLRTRPLHVLAMVWDLDQGAHIVRDAAVLCGLRHARLSVLCSRPAAGRRPVVFPGCHLQFPRKGETLLDAARRLIAESGVGLLVSDWSRDTTTLRAALAVAADMGIPAVFVRANGSVAIRRVLIPTGGGPHVLQQLWVANELAVARGVPTTLLRVVPSSAPGRDSTTVEPLQSDGAQMLTRMHGCLLGVPQKAEIVIADDVVTGITAVAQRDDLVVLGAADHSRIPNALEDSIPERLAWVLPNQLAMLVAPKPDRPCLRHVLWDDVVRVGMAPRDKRHAISMLVDVLAEHGQIPFGWGERVLQMAMAREELCPTAVGCETAFPHVALPEFSGVAGCLGICPSGVAFSSDDPELTQFLFLLVTPTHDYGGYLNVLGMIARRMVQPEVRARLLQCSSGSQAIRVLEEEGAHCTQPEDCAYLLSEGVTPEQGLVTADEARPGKA